MAPLKIFVSPARHYLRAQAIRSSPATQFSPRPFSQTSLSPYPRKDSQDRESIDTEATEYSKSGTDDGAARQEEAAFDPNNTDPEQEKKVAGEGQGEGNPLDVSPANPDVSQQRGKTEGGAENSGNERRSSGGGSPKKSGTQ